MQESVKAVCILVVIASLLTAVLVWTDDRPDATVWLIRWCTILGPLAAVVVFFAIGARRDRAPDLLLERAATYFNQDGFCFSVLPEVIDDVLYLEAWFQCQYDRPCRGVVLLQPARGFWMNRANLEELKFEIECGPAAYGVARLPLPVPREYQGKKQEFEVRATAEYPDGKGQRLRFHQGIPIGSESKGAASGRAVFSALALLTGTLVTHKTARLKLELPAGIAEELPDAAIPPTETLWKLGDPVA